MNKKQKNKKKTEKTLPPKLPKRKMTTGQRMADLASRMVGSWGFILFQTILIVIWVFFNVYGFFNKWDPYPFIFLNLALSILSAYAAPIILMSQNRETERDRARAISDLATDRKAERGIQDIRKTLKRLERKIDHVKRNGNNGN